MASSTAAGLGLPDPRMIDPYPIEGTLAQATLNPTTQAAALPLLGMYQAQRATNSANYMDQLALQRALTQQKLSSDTAQQAAKGFNELWERGLGGLVTPDSVFGQAGWTAGQDPNTLARLSSQGERSIEGLTFERAMAGAKAGSEAGIQTTPAGITALTRMPAFSATPTSTVNTGITAAAGLEGALAPTRPKVTVKSNLPSGDTVETTGPPGSAQQSLTEADRLRQAGAGGTVPGNRAPITVGNTVKPAPGANTAATAQQQANAVMQKLTASTDQAHQQALADIKAASGNGPPKVVQLANGAWAIQGAKGQYGIR